MPEFVLSFDCGEEMIVDATSLASAIRVDDLGRLPTSIVPLSWAHLRGVPAEKNGQLRATVVRIVKPLSLDVIRACEEDELAKIYERIETSTDVSEMMGLDNVASELEAKLNGSVRSEKGRQKNNLEKLATVLSDKQWHLNTELIEVAGFRYGGRLFDLRARGWETETEHVGEGVWRYRATRFPSDTPVVCDDAGQALMPLGGE